MIADLSKSDLTSSETLEEIWRKSSGFERLETYVVQNLYVSSEKHTRYFEKRLGGCLVINGRQNIYFCVLQKKVIEKLTLIF